MIDTHAHLHFAESFPDVTEALERAEAAGVEAIINVGVTPQDSRAALRLARQFWRLDADGKLTARTETPVPRLFASAGLHPHEAGDVDQAMDLIHDLAEDVVAIGECGLDYFKNHASKADQDRALRMQIDIALEHNLPLIFHVRDAWDDFFAVVRDQSELRGVIHSFTGQQAEVERALEYPGLSFGLNGIMTFTKDEAQLAAAKLIPADKLLLETDCPYLAPPPHRGKRNESSYVGLVGEFLATLRGVSVSDLATQTAANANALFDLDIS